MTPSTDPPERVVLDSDDIARTLTRMAHELLERNHGAENLLLIGIQTRGVPLAQRLGTLMSEAAGVEVSTAQLDITLYRDDLREHPTRPVGATRVPTTLEGRTVVLVDDVLYSGRTIVAALDALKDIPGRPDAVQLAVLVDRGHRDYPISADVVGRSLPTAADERVTVALTETDDHDAVTLTRTDATR